MPKPSKAAPRRKLKFAPPRQASTPAADAPPTPKPGEFVIMWCRGWGGLLPAHFKNGAELLDLLQTVGHFGFGGEVLDATVEVLNTEHPAGAKRYKELLRRASPAQITRNDTVFPGLISICTMSG